MSENDYSDIVYLFGPQGLPRSTFNSFNENKFWARFKAIHLHSFDSEELMNNYNELRRKLSEYQISENPEIIDAEKNEILNIHKHLFKECRQIEFGENKYINSQKLLSHFKYSVIIVPLYFLYIVIMSSSLKPKRWYSEFLRQMDSVSGWLHGVFSISVILLFGVFSYYLLSKFGKRFPSLSKKIPREVIVLLWIGFWVLSFAIVESGIYEIFGFEISAGIRK